MAMICDDVPRGNDSGRNPAADMEALRAGPGAELGRDVPPAGGRGAGTG